jgi:hypothetical protein
MEGLAFFFPLTKGGAVKNCVRNSTSFSFRSSPLFQGRLEGVSVVESVLGDRLSKNPLWSPLCKGDRIPTDRSIHSQPQGEASTAQGLSSKDGR